MGGIRKEEDEAPHFSLSLVTWVGSGELHVGESRRHFLVYSFFKVFFKTLFYFLHLGLVLTSGKEMINVEAPSYTRLMGV